jgi:hypothetical protein
LNVARGRDITYRGGRDRQDIVAHVFIGEPLSTPDRVGGRLSPGHAL